MGLPTPFNPNASIPNNPFYSTQNWFIQGWQGPLILGAGLNVQYDTSTLNASSGGSAGAVNQIVAGTGISVNPSGGTGVVIVNNAGVTSIVAGAGISISGATGAVTINATGGTGTVTSISAGSGLSAGPNPITTAGTLTLNYACVVDPTDFTAKGAILAGTGVSTYSALPVGTNGQVLTACSTAPNGVCWGLADPTAIQCSQLTAKGALITATGPSTPFTLGVGTDGQVLVACSAAGSGLCWTANTAAVTPATPTANGAVFGCTLGSGSFNTGLGYGVLGTPGAGSGGNVALGPYSLAVSNDAVGNVGVGSGALCTVTDGNFNIGVGFLSLSTVTDGTHNIGLGYTAGTALTGSETGNVIIGGNAGAAGLDNQIILSDGFGGLRLQINECGALSFNGTNYGTAGQVLCSGGPGTTWGWTSAGAGPVPATPTVEGTVLGCTTASLTAIGCNAMLSATGAGNTAMGCAALGSVTTGSNNTAFGFSAGCSNTNNNNTFVGTYAGKQVTTGADNVALGFCSLGCAGAHTGGGNTAIGTSSLACNTSGNYNVALGWQNSLNVTTGSCNVSIGYKTLGCGSAGVTGGFNIAIGTISLPAVTTANANIVIGGASHAALATGSCNIAIGGQNNVGANNHCFTTIIGNGFTTTQSCQVIIGWVNGGTTATFVQGAGAWTVSSDEKQKSDIQDLAEGLELVEKLQPRTYDFIGGCEEGEDGAPAFGLIAQEVAAAIEGTSLEGRGLVNKVDEEHLGVSYASLTVILINAVKELSARVKELESK